MMATSDQFSIKCKHCGKNLIFDQPYPYHAGFADQGFLYNDAGTLTLVWSVVDPIIDQLFPEQPAWTLSLINRWHFEKLLLPAPTGGRWRFRNPARCTQCARPVSKHLFHSIHYLVYPGSIITDQNNQFRLLDYMTSAAKHR
jgi:hypothetical protein